MTVKVKTVEITVPGSVVRNRDGEGNTVLILTGEQIQVIYEGTARVMQLFNRACPDPPLSDPIITTIQENETTTEVRG